MVHIMIEGLATDHNASEEPTQLVNPFVRHSLDAVERYHMVVFDRRETHKNFILHYLYVLSIQYTQE